MRNAGREQGNEVLCRLFLVGYNREQNLKAEALVGQVTSFHSPIITLLGNMLSFLALLFFF